jgi:hypothetical protein
MNGLNRTARQISLGPEIDAGREVVPRRAVCYDTL